MAQKFSAVPLWHQQSAEINAGGFVVIFLSVVPLSRGQEQNLTGFCKM